MRRALLLVVFAVLACSPKGNSGSADDEQAIRDGVTKWATRWNQGDAKALAVLVSPDYESVDASGVHTEGRAAFEQSMTAQLAARTTGATLTLKTSYVQWLSPNSAVAGGSWSVSPTAPDGPGRGSWVSTVRRSNGAWLVTSGLIANEPPSMPMASDTAHTRP